MSIQRLFDVVECRGYIGRRVAALVLPISNRARVTSSCAGKLGLREPGEHTSGPNLASRDDVTHNQTLYTILETPPPVIPLCRKQARTYAYQMVACWLAASNVGAVLLPTMMRLWFDVVAQTILPVMLAGGTLRALPTLPPFSFLPSRLLASTKLCARRLGPREAPHGAAMGGRHASRGARCPLL